MEPLTNSAQEMSLNSSAASTHTHTSDDHACCGVNTIQGKMPFRVDVHTHVMPRQLPDLKQKYGYGGGFLLHLSLPLQLPIPPSIPLSGRKPCYNDGPEGAVNWNGYYIERGSTTVSLVKGSLLLGSAFITTCRFLFNLEYSTIYLPLSSTS
jgi:hypothetical protein